MANNAKLATSNEELVAVVKKLSNENKDLQRETLRLKKKGGGWETQEKSYPTLCSNCEKEGYHEPDACFELENNKDNLPPGWKIWL